MHTRKHTLGKFQGNESEMLAQAVYNASMDGCCETLGDCETFGFYAYVPGKRNDYILNENSQGFVYVEYGPPAKIQAMWKAIGADYEEFCGEEESDDDVEDE